MKKYIIKQKHLELLPNRIPPKWSNTAKHLFKNKNFNQSHSTPSSTAEFICELNQWLILD